MLLSHTLTMWGSLVEFRPTVAGTDRRTDEDGGIHNIPILKKNKKTKKKQKKKNVG